MEKSHKEIVNTDTIFLKANLHSTNLASLKTSAVLSILQNLQFLLLSKIIFARANRFFRSITSL